MLRHSRAMTRHHRERVINKRQKEYSTWFNWIPDKLGVLSKPALHHHHCELCSSGHYKREKFDWKREIAQ